MNRKFLNWDYYLKRKKIKVNQKGEFLLKQFQKVLKNLALFLFLQYHPSYNHSVYCIGKYFLILFNYHFQLRFDLNHFQVCMCFFLSFWTLLLLYLFIFLKGFSKTQVISALSSLATPCTFYLMETHNRQPIAPYTLATSLPT